MGKMSRDKGNRYERKIATLFSEAFNRDMRRVPASGGLDIKCDIYDPFDDSFPYFIECKCRNTFKFTTVFSGVNELFDFVHRNDAMANLSYLCTKYLYGPIPIVVFSGGDFRGDYVAVTGLNIDKSLVSHKCYGSSVNHIFVNKIYIIGLDTFLKYCSKRPLQLRESRAYDTKIIEEDDGNVY